MRGAFLIGIVVVLLIIGFLVINNVGVDHSGGVTQTRAKKVIDRAEKTANDAEKKIKNIRVQTDRNNSIAD